MELIESAGCKIINQLKKIPSHYKKFTLNEETAEKTYGIKKEHLNQFIEQGLEFQEFHNERFFDRYDLSNLSLYFKLPSIQRMAMRTWGSTLKQSTQFNHIQIMISYLLANSLLNEQTTMPIKILTPDQGRITKYFHEQPCVYTFSTNKFIQQFLLKNEAAKLIDQVKDIDFYMIPEELRWNIDFIKNNNMAECGGISKYLYQLAIQNHIPARQLYGILLAKPYSTTHYWTEFLIDEKWIAADPLLIKLLIEQFKLDSTLWNIYSPPSIAFLPLCKVRGYLETTGQPLLEYFTDEKAYLNPLVTYNNEELLLTIPTEISYS